MAANWLLCIGNMLHTNTAFSDHHLKLRLWIVDLLGHAKYRRMYFCVVMFTVECFPDLRSCVAFQWWIYIQNFPAHAPLWGPILSFSHTFSPKSAHIGGSCPPKWIHAPYGKSWICPCFWLCDLAITQVLDDRN